GHPEPLAYASVRFGIGRFNTVEEIEQVAQQAIATIKSLRKAQPTTIKNKF
ncbi:MAG TPA: IscS subfamily cysteine desulfurase, partial [Cyanobacteria bacterium UBA11148]|nr:IscS subfamily cysteine desulfurase [Cyanobacteria bacterium UBA11148]